MCYKVKYRENFFLLRGNHEASPINRIYGFFDECTSTFVLSTFSVLSTSPVADHVPRSDFFPSSGWLQARGGTTCGSGSSSMRCLTASPSRL